MEMTMQTSMSGSQARKAKMQGLILGVISAAFLLLSATSSWARESGESSRSNPEPKISKDSKSNDKHGTERPKNID